MTSANPIMVPSALCPVETAIEAEIERHRRATEAILAAAPVPLATWIRMRLLVAGAADAHEAGLPVVSMVSGAVAAIELGARRRG